jgi:hypothetical protein
MSNLGWYQVMTTVAKKVGGPRNLFLLTLGAGGALYKCGEVAVKRTYKKVKGLNEKVETLKVYNVTADGKSGKGLVLNSGDTYKILESDGESILIEKIGDSNNPYFVSADFLRTVSDYI